MMSNLCAREVIDASEPGMDDNLNQQLQLQGDEVQKLVQRRQATTLR